METLQVGFMVIGAFILWSSMSLTAPVPVTPTDVTGELNSMLELLQRIRGRGTAQSNSDRRKQEALDQVFEEAEDAIQELLQSIEQKGEVMKNRAGTDEVEYNQAWDGLTEAIEAVKASFVTQLQKIDREFGGMQSLHASLAGSQSDVKKLIQEALVKSRDAQASMDLVLGMYN